VAGAPTVVARVSNRRAGNSNMDLFSPAATQEWDQLSQRIPPHQAVIHQNDGFPCQDVRKRVVL